MDPADFSQQSPGQLVRAPDGYWAFVPDPLPSRFDLDLPTVSLLTEAERGMGELVGVGKLLPNPHLLIGPFLRREAILSSRIEGTITTAQELLLFEAGEPESPPKPDVREVRNYVDAMEFGLKRLKELPVCLRLTKELHDRLLRGVRGEEHRPGEFRDRQNFIGSPGQSVNEARFVPPPVTEMHKALHEFETYLSTPSELPVLVQLALVHYQFETIHPFMDGNGRIGRLLITLLLCERACLAQPLLYLSGYFERNRDAYMDHLLRLSQRGNWLEWVNFFVRGVAEQSKDAIERADKLYNLWDVYTKRVTSARSSALCIQLIDELFAYPAITVSRAVGKLQVTPRSAQLNVDKLVAHGILREVTGRQRNRIYVAHEIIAAIEAERAR